MVNPVRHQTDGLAYQQVLDRFALTDLLHHLKTYFDAIGVILGHWFRWVGSKKACRTRDTENSFLIRSDEILG